MSGESIQRLLAPSLLKHAGTYALLMKMACSGHVTIGRLGQLRLEPGFYLYVGSAFGPGGVRARVSRHLRPSANSHWHLDYLKPYLTTLAVWHTYDPVRRECQWAATLANTLQPVIPLAGFGASDCRCQTHLMHFKHSPAFDEFCDQLAVLSPHAPVFNWQPGQVIGDQNLSQD